MPDLPLAAVLPLVLIGAAIWVTAAVDVLRTAPSTRARVVWMAVLCVFWVMGPIAWGIVRVHRARRALRTS